MKTKSILFVLVSILFITVSCRVKESCELNHTGTIEITNNTLNSIEVFVDNTKVLDIEVGKTNTIIKPIGTYEIKCMHFPDEYIYTANVFECETTKISVPE